MRFDFIKRKFVEVDQNPERLAVVGADRSLSWSGLRHEVERLASNLDGHSGPQALTVIRGRKQAGMIVSILACYSKAIPYAPVDKMVPAERFEAICKIAGATILIDVADEAGSLTPKPVDFQTSAWRASDVAYVMFTSGSSGEPKGVQIQAANLCDLAKWLSSPDFYFSPDSVFLNNSAYGFDLSVFETLASLQCGGTLVLMDGAEIPASVSPTCWSSTPSALSKALASATFNQERFPNLKDFYVCGEIVRHNLVRRLWQKFPQSRFWNTYGPTEATVFTTLVEVTPQVLEAHSTVPIGRAKPGVQIRTSAEDGCSEGELWIVGPNVSPGYLNRPDLNESRFFTWNDQRGYKTGDLGFIEDGMLFFKGRMDHQIKLHGFRIELDEIDVQVEKIEGVEEAATVPLRSPEGDVKKLVCFVKLNQRTAVKPDELKELLGRVLPYYMIPAQFIPIDGFPYNANHKIDKSVLAARIFQGSGLSSSLS